MTQMSAIERARALIEQHKNQSTGSGRSFDNTLFAHWKVPVGKSAIIRFLPDADENNPFFWYDRCTRNLEFTAIKGMSIANTAKVTIPAFNTYRKGPIVNIPDECRIEKSDDPIQEVVSSWYEEKQDLYKKYNRSWSHVLQAFIRDDGGAEKTDEAPEFGIRRLLLTSSLMEQVRSILDRASVRHLPTDYENGRNFEIRVTKKGEYNNYESSSWDFEPSPLTEREALYLAEHELFDLKKFVPKKPNAEEIEIMFEMFEASIDGLPYDPVRWGNYFKPSGIDISVAMTTGRTTVEVKAPVQEEEEEPVVAKATASSILSKMVNKVEEEEAPVTTTVQAKQVTNNALTALLESKKKKVASDD